MENRKKIVYYRLSGAYLGFSVGNEYYLLHVQYVKTVAGFRNVVPLSTRRKYIAGTVREQGEDVYVIDIAELFGIVSHDESLYDSMIMVEWEKNGELFNAAIPVGNFGDVYTVVPDDIENTPMSMSEADAAYVSALASVDGKIRKIVDFEAVSGILHQYVV